LLLPALLQPQQQQQQQRCKHYSSVQSSSPAAAAPSPSSDAELRSIAAACRCNSANPVNSSSSPGCCSTCMQQQGQEVQGIASAICYLILVHFLISPASCSSSPGCCRTCRQTNKSAAWKLKVSLAIQDHCHHPGQLLRPHGEPARQGRHTAESVAVKLALSLPPRCQAAAAPGMAPTAAASPGVRLHYASQHKAVHAALLVAFNRQCR
jgi:hypothetical protein